MSKLKAAIEAAKRQNQNLRAKASPTTGLVDRRKAVLTASGLSDDGDFISTMELPRIPVDWERFRKNRILAHNERHPAEAAYRMLRTRIMQRMRANEWKFLGVSSMGPNEGKTYTAINLAISIAAEVGQEAVLLDLDLRRPSVSPCLGLDPTSLTKLAEFLAGSIADVRELLVCPGIDRLGCIATGSPLERPSDFLASRRGKQLFDELRARLLPETVVIVDLPPLLTVDDALAVAPMIDGLLFVVADREAKRDDLVAAHDLLQEFNVVGSVLNKSVDKDERKGYYDSN